MPQRERDRAPFRRAHDRGQLSPAADIELAIDQLAGPVFYRVLISGRSVSSEFTDALVQSYLDQSGTR